VRKPFTIRYHPVAVSFPPIKNSNQDTERAKSLIEYVIRYFVAFGVAWALADLDIRGDRFSAWPRRLLCLGLSRLARITKTGARYWAYPPITPGAGG
jgi:hypothetical protein